MKKMTGSAASLLILTSAFLILSGCGYTTASLLPPGLDSVYVANFTNEISPAREISDRRASYFYRPGIENEVTRAIIDGFIFDRHLRIDPEKKADLLMEGSLVDIRQYPLSYADNFDIVEYRMEVFVDIRLYEKSTGKMLWEEKGFMGQTSYTVTGPNKKTETEAQRSAVKDLAQRVVERTVENW